MTMKLKTLALVLALTPAMVTAAPVYKWTDSDGITHYGDRQPTGIEVEQISVKSGMPQPVSPPATAQEQLNDLEKRRQDESEQATVEDEAAARKAQREANCQAATQNLDIIRKNGRIRMTVNGEQRFLTPEEIAEQKTRLEGIVEQNCGDETAP